MARYDELRNAYGNHFEDLFSDLMKDKYGLDYKQTSTNGNTGDLKVDGVLKFSIAFSVYAPETYNDNKTIKKLKSDFEGFIAHRKKGNWQEIKKYIFVIKRERAGVTSNVLNLISSFEKIFPVNIMTMDDIYRIMEGNLPFSEDGRLLQEFKTDVTDIMEYIIETDFSSQSFRMSLSDDIELGILSKWNKKAYLFSSDIIESCKQDILITLNELCQYLTPNYMHAIKNGQIIFNNDSWEAGEKLRNELAPQIRRIRFEVRDLLEELYNIA